MKINEIGTIAERLVKLIDHFAKGNKAAFGRQADIQSGVLAGMIGGRMSKPGFELLQKLLTAYPTVEPIWLLFGRGPMLRERLVAREVVPLPSDLSEEGRSILAEVQGLSRRMREQEMYLEGLREAEELTKVYRISINHPGSRRLSERLDITEEEARNLVLSGKIRSKYIGLDNDRARLNGASYLITERAVQEFLQDIPNTSLSTDRSPGTADHTR